MKFRRLGKEMWDMSKFPPGLQLYTLRNEIQIDLFGTLKKVAEMGYKLVEFFSWGYGGIPADEIKKALNRLNLGVVSTYVSHEDLENDLQPQIEYALKLGVQYIVTGFPEERFRNESSIQGVISSLKKISKEIKQRGLQFLYHPHAHEYKQVGNRRIIDRLLEGVGTDLMKLELDLYWAKKEGLNPLTTLVKYKDLSPLIHVKDIDKNGDFVEVGSGIIDWPSIFRILKDVGVKYYFVEQEFSKHPLKSARMSLDYLRSIGVVSRV